MILSARLVLASFLAGSGLALKLRDTHTAAVNDNSTVAAPKKFIVEFTKGSNYQALREQIANRQGTRILREFNTDVFSGVSVETSGDNVDTLQALASVSNVWSNKIIKLSPHEPTLSFTEDATAANYSVHSWTGVDKLHAMGIFGKGAVVAVIDTGTQYTHPGLGGGFGPGHTVAGGYDFVGDGYWPYTGWVKEPDEDPMDQLGHGTHVAGIIAGRTERFIGVAPEATLLSYKVFGRVDGTDEDTLIEAFLRAYEDGADIITSSIGGHGGWSTDAWAEVASRLVDQGIVVTIAAGNSGESGPFFASNGAAGRNVLAVASAEASTLVATPFLATFTLGGISNTTEVAYLPGWDYFPAEVKGWPIVPLSLQPIESEACEPLPAGTRNLSQVIPLVRRGGCEYVDKQQNLQDFGAKYFLIYNNDEPVEAPWSYRWESYLGMIEEKAGIAIMETVKAGGNVTADFSLNPNTNYVGIYNSAGGKPNGFTSFGGLYDLQIKPDIAAPGGQIFSTYPTDRFTTLSGTSMATPYVAGVAALYVGKYGGRKTHGAGFARMLQGRLAASGAAMPWADGYTDKDYGFWAPVPQVGNGLIDAFKVLNYSTGLSFVKFALNDTHHHSRYHGVDITNNAAESVTYRFTLQDAGGFEAWQPLDENVYASPRLKALNELVPVKMVPKVKMPSGTFTVKPGETRKAEFIFEYPQGLTNIPVYSGKLLISGSNGEQLSVPYFGVASNLKNEIRRQFMEGYPLIASGTTWPPVEIKDMTSFSFNLSLEAQDFPRASSRTHWGVQEIRWDIFAADWTERGWKYPPVVGKDGFVGTVAYYADSNWQWAFDPAQDDFNNTVSFPLHYLHRSAFGTSEEQYWWLGRLGNGSVINPGNYTMRFAVLAPFGTPSHSDNWDVVTYKFSVSERA